MDQVNSANRVLIGQWGARLTPYPPGQEPSLARGRILGLYLGAVLDRDTEEHWRRTYENYPHYRMDLRQYGMSAEGAANIIGFPNTYLQPDVSGRPAPDDNVINAIFIGFDVRLPDRSGGFRRESIMAMVALDNAFGAANPHRIVWVDFGEGYLQNFPTIKVEDGS